MSVHLYHSRKKRHYWLDSLSVGLTRLGVDHKHLHEDEYEPSAVAVTIGWRTIEGALDRNHVIEEQERRGLRQMTLELGFFGDRNKNRSLGWGGPAGGLCDYRNAGMPSDRWDRHGVHVADWRLGGGYILFARQTPGDSSLFHVDGYDAQVSDICDRLARDYQMPVRVREHPKVKRPRATLAEDLAGACRVATFSSNVAVDGLLWGVPAITHYTSIAAPVALTLPYMAGDPRPDRTKWLASLAYAQWTDAEFRSGEVWEHLNR